MGAERCGVRFVGALDFDKFACQTYAANYGESPLCKDIRDVAVENLPEHDILFAGFPCNSFSTQGIAGRAARGLGAGLECGRYGGLIWDVLRVLGAHRPSLVVLENVKNILFHRKGETFRIIREAFEDAGYPLWYRLMDAYPYVPQHRYRVYMVAVDVRRYPNFIMRFPKPPNAKPVLADVLGGPIKESAYISEKLWAYLQKATATKHKDGGGFRHTICGRDEVAKTLCARYFSDGREILIDEGRPTPRRLTPREAARLMGFPDSFILPCSNYQTYRQLGNSVVPPLVEAVVRSALKCCYGAQAAA